jgi:hydroxymethylglutaryl-CoA reductase
MKWVDRHFKSIKKIAESTTNYGKLIRIDQYPIQNYVVLDMIMDTGNAAGQNMVTLAAKTACDFIKAKTNNDFILESIITTEALEKMKLQKNDELLALIKANELSIQEVLND